MNEQPQVGIAAPDVEIFDPPLCCPTGLCGPVLDTTLVDLSEAIFTLEAEGRRAAVVSAQIGIDFAANCRSGGGCCG